MISRILNSFIKAYPHKSEGIIKHIRNFWYLILDMYRDRVARDANTVNANPIERYRYLRVDFLTGITTKEGWKNRLRIDQKNNLRTNDVYQLRNATCLIAHNIFTNFVNELNEVYKIFDPQGVNLEDIDQIKNRFVDRQNYQIAICKINGYIQNTYENILDLVAYYNEHFRRIEMNYNYTTYRKIMIPHANTSFEEKTTKITDNELDINTSALKITDKQVADMMLKEEKELSDLINTFDAKLKSINKIIKNNTKSKQDLSWRETIALESNKSDSLDQVIHMVCEFNETKTMLEIEKKLEIYNVLIKKGKLRKVIIQKLARQYKKLMKNYVELLNNINCAANVDYTVKCICSNEQQSKIMFDNVVKESSQIQNNPFCEKFLQLNQQKYYQKHDYLSIPREKLFKAYMYTDSHNYGIPLKSDPKYFITIDNYHGMKVTLPSYMKGIFEINSFDFGEFFINPFFTAQADGIDITFFEFLLLPYICKEQSTTDDIESINKILVSNKTSFKHSQYRENKNAFLRDEEMNMFVKEFDIVSDTLKIKFCKTLCLYAYAAYGEDFSKIVKHAQPFLDAHNIKLIKYKVKIDEFYLRIVFTDCLNLILTKLLLSFH